MKNYPLNVGNSMNMDISLRIVQNIPKRKMRKIRKRGGNNLREGKKNPTSANNAGKGLEKDQGQPEKSRGNSTSN